MLPENYEINILSQHQALMPYIQYTIIIMYNMIFLFYIS
jgi:hypothetical protein